MADPPRELAVLLDGSDPESRDRAWSSFLARYSDLLLRVARRFGGGYDAAMDRYEHVLERLRADDFKRLRAYRARDGSGFESWLVVVARRLCLDHTRARYGRARQGETRETAERRAMRRRLAKLTGLELEEELLAAPRTANPERRLRERELQEALDAALAELPARERLLVTLRFEDERPVREIREILGLPSVFHVYRRLDRALEALRLRLRERGVHDPAP